MRFTFFDTETTGFDEDDEVVQLAYIDMAGEKLTPFVKEFKPSKPVGFKAMAIHGLTNEYLADKPMLSDSIEMVSRFKKRGMTRCVGFAHNADFDIKMLSRNGASPEYPVVDTLRCSKHLLEDAEGYSLGVLYYQYGLNRKMDDLASKLKIDTSCLGAHNAMYDTMMLYLLAMHLLDKVDGHVATLLRLTKQPVKVKEFPFGKYKGQRISDVASENPGYLQWMLENISDMSEDLRYTLEQYV